MSDSSTNEFAAFQKIHEALSALDAGAQVRVLNSVSTLLGIERPISKGMPAQAAPIHDDTEDSNDAIEASSAESFDEFAELYAAADPTPNSDKALVAGYWIQVCQGHDNFSGHSVNAELNHLGHRLPNVTNALSALNGMKPQLVLQLKKSGKSQQARKTYKLSAEGIKVVQGMING